MKSLHRENLWLQNRIGDLGFFISIAMLFTPLAGFHFIREEPKFYIGVFFGFMNPQYLAVGVLGIIGLIHHLKQGGYYSDPLKSFSLFFFSILLIFYGILLFQVLFFPNLPDCIVSFLWKTNPCMNVDFERTQYFSFTFFGLPFVYCFLLLFIRFFQGTPT